MRRPWSFRTWLIIGIVAIVVTSYLGTGVLALLSEVLTPSPWEVKPFPARPPAELEALFTRAESQSDQWVDPAWQAELRPELDRLELQVQLFGPDGAVRFEHPPAAALGQTRQLGPVTITAYASDQIREVVIYQGVAPVGRAVWRNIRQVAVDERQAQWTSQSNTWVPVGIVIIVSTVVWAATTLALRSLMRPLSQMAEASRQISQGNLDVTLPTTPIREVNDFALSFAVMRDGLKESISQQAAMEQERRLFVAAMAHDLRTPLTSVRGYLEGIRDGVARTPDKLDRYVQVALEKTGALEHLVDGLFNYSRTEYLNQPPQQEPLDLGELITAAVTAMRPRAEAKAITLALDPALEACIVPGDATMLNRVIDNLLDNALRHTPRGGSVTAGWRGGLEHARFWIQDSGPGIPPEDLPRVFQPLYRADKARSTHTGGAGLGLAIAKRLIEAHGGMITVQNQNGALFSISLPALQEPSRGM